MQIKEKFQSLNFTYIEVPRLWAQLQHDRAFVDFAYLLVHFDVLFRWPITGCVPTKKIQIFENLLVCFDEQ